jgi:hypothetical protein
MVVFFLRVTAADFGFVALEFFFFAFFFFFTRPLPPAHHARNAH